MDKKTVIEKAREFAERSLSGNIKNVNKEDYFMFLISRFLLLKEKIIKKDSEKNEIYFNYNEGKNFLSVIKYIVDYIKENGKVEVDSKKVIIIPKVYNDSLLRFYIAAFNKLRDSFAHGMYEFDLENEQLIIVNDHSNDVEPYVLNCTLPISVLEFFTYALKKPQSKYLDNEIIEFKEYSKKLRDNFGYKYNYNDKIIKNYNLNQKIISNYNYNNDKIINNNILNINKENHNLKQIKNFYNNVKENDNYNLRESSKEQEEILDLLLKLILNDNKLNNQERLVLFTYLKKLGLLESDLQVNKPKIKRNNNPDKKYKEKLSAVIKEMCSILGIKTKNNNTITIAAIYNYMQLTFSLNKFKFKSKEDKKNLGLGYLKVSKLNPLYIKSNNGIFDNNNDSEYIDKINSIEKNIATKIIPNMKKQINQYKNNPNPTFRVSINEMFKKFYEEIISSFADKNALILTSIRNSIEHGNVHDFNGCIMLHDQSNQNDEQSINFCCWGTAKDFYEITKNIETGKLNEEFTFEDFLDELKSIIDISLFNELLKIVNEIKKINAEALITVLKQGITR